MPSGAELAILISGKNQSKPAFKEAGADVDKLNKSVDDTKKGLPGMAGALDVAKGAAIAGGLALAGMGAAVAAVVAPAASFESAMSGIGAVSGATAGEMANLQALALQLGKDTAFSANEAAQGIAELIKGGLSIEDVMGGGAKAALDLAAAGEISVADAAEIASNAVGQFGLKGAELGHVADMIAGAANASSISVSDFKFSLSAAGAVAATVGFSFDDLSVAIAEMGKAGIKGSDAGTSLKTMMLNLQPSTKAQVGMFQQLGIVTIDYAEAQKDLRGILLRTAGGQEKYNKLVKEGKDSAVGLFDAVKASIPDWQDLDFNKWSNDMGLMGNSFFTAEGKVKSMAQVQGILKEAMKDLTEQQKIAALEVMFGSDAIRAGAVLTKEGSEGYDTMAASMGKVTAAAVGAQKMDNLNGVLQALSGSLETAAITAGLALTPALKKIAQGVTDMVNGAMPMVERFAAQLPALLEQAGAFLTDTVVPQLQAFAEAAGPVLASAFEFIVANGDTIKAILIGVAAGFAALITVAAVAGTITTVGAALAFLISPIGLVVAAIALLTAAWVGNWGDIQGKTAAAWAFLQPILAGIGEAISAAWTAAQPALAALGEGLGMIGAAFDAGGIQGALGMLGQLMMQGLAALGGLAMQALAPVGQAIGGFFSSLGTTVHNAITGAWGAVTSVVVGAVQGTIAAMGDAWNGMVGVVTDAVSAVAGAIGSGIQAAVDLGLSIWEAFQVGVQTIWEKIPEDIRADLELIASTLVQRFTDMVASGVKWVTDMAAAIAAGWARIIAAVTTAVTAVWTAITSKLTEIGTAVGTWIGTQVAAFTAWGTSVLAVVTGAALAIWTAITTKLTELTAAIGTWIAGVISSFTTFATNVGTKAAEVGTNIFTPITTKIGEVLSAIGTWAGNVLGRLIQMATDVGAQAVAIGGAIVQGIRDGLIAGWEGLSNFIGDLARGLLDTAKAALDIHSPSGQFRIIGQSLGQGLALGVADTAGEAAAAVVEMAQQALAEAGGQMTDSTAKFGAGLGEQVAKSFTLAANKLQLGGVIPTALAISTGKFGAGLGSGDPKLKSSIAKFGAGLGTPTALQPVLNGATGGTANPGALPGGKPPLPNVTITNMNITIPGQFLTLDAAADAVGPIIVEKLLLQVNDAYANQAQRLDRVQPGAD